MLPGIHEPIAQTNDQYPPLVKGKLKNLKHVLKKEAEQKNKNGLLDPVFSSSVLSAGLSFVLMVLNSASRKSFVKPFFCLFSLKKGTTPLPKHYRLLTLYT